MRFVEAMMKAIWGTDEKHSLPAQREAGDQLLADVERKVEKLNETLALHNRAARNLDEAMEQITQRGR